MLLAVSGTLTLAGNANAQTANPSNEAAPIYTTLEELDWRPMDPTEPDGPRVAVLWGDPATGPYGAYQTYPAGSASPLHSFSTDQKIIMIRGTTLHWTETGSFEAAKQKPLGAFMLMPAGIKHYAACAQGEDCVVFVTQDGPFDFKVD